MRRADAFGFDQTPAISVKIVGAQRNAVRRKHQEQKEIWLLASGGEKTPSDVSPIAVRR